MLSGYAILRNHIKIGVFISLPSELTVGVVDACLMVDIRIVVDVVIIVVVVVVMAEIKNIYLDNLEPRLLTYPYKDILYKYIKH